MKRESPFFSIIVPIYNMETYLDCCLSSILRQSYQDYEVLMIDDGSLDSSPDICRNYLNIDERMKYYRIKNGGLLHARVYGVGFASGQYVLFCDSDDSYSGSRSLEIIHDTLVKNPCDCLQFGYYKQFRYIKKGKAKVDSPLLIGAEEIRLREYPKFLCSLWDDARVDIYIWSKAIRRNLFVSLPDESEIGRVFWGEDLILDLFLFENARSLMMIPEKLYNYRQKSGGTSRWNRSTMWDLDSIKHYQLVFLDRYPGDHKEQIREILYFELADWLFHHIVQGIDVLSQPEMSAYLAEVMNLPSFMKARDYYRIHQPKNESQRLLRDYKLDDYLEAAKRKAREPVSYKTRVKAFLRNHV